VEVKTDGDVMGVDVNCYGVRYAIIQASSNKDRPERLVIAYKDENCLRNLVAAPSILKLGFVSRGEAIANLTRLAFDTAPSRQKYRITTMSHETEENGKCTDRHNPVKHPRIPHRILQSAPATLIALFYSKNLVSTMIRMALGASL